MLFGKFNAFFSKYFVDISYFSAAISFYFQRLDYDYSSKMNFICGYPDIYFVGEPFPEFETSTELYD